MQLDKAVKVIILNWTTELIYKVNIFWFANNLIALSIGHTDPYPWHRSDSWLVPADSQEATGSEYNGLGQQ